MIGEMRSEKGKVRDVEYDVRYLPNYLCQKVTFNDHVAYVPQSPWIRNATIRDNILFGQKYEDSR